MGEKFSAWGKHEQNLSISKLHLQRCVLLHRTLGKEGGAARALGMRRQWWRSVIGFSWTKMERLWRDSKLVVCSFCCSGGVVGVVEEYLPIWCNEE